MTDGIGATTMGMVGSTQMKDGSRGDLLLRELERCAGAVIGLPSTLALRAAQ